MCSYCSGDLTAILTPCAMHNIAGKTLAGTDKGRGRGEAKAAAYGVIDLTSRTPSPRAPSWRTKTPFLMPSASPMLLKLQIAFLADMFVVDVPRRTNLVDAMELVNEAFGGGRSGGPKATGERWTVAQWGEVKCAAMFADGEVLMEAVVVKVM